MNILNEREKTHGEFEAVANISQNMKLSMRELTGFTELPWMHAEALDMICVKIARIICGDHNETDHWTDIKGYAELVLKHIKSVPSGSSTKEPPNEPSQVACTADFRDKDGKCIHCGADAGTLHEVYCPKRGPDWDYYNPRNGISR